GSWLQVSHAFHSALMDPMLKEFTRVAEGIQTQPPAIPVVSTLTGELVEEFTAGYWAEQVRGTVRFADAVNRLGALGVTRFVELCPDAHLTAAITEACDDETVLTVPALRRNRDEPDTLMRALAHLWADGTEIDWHAFYAPTDAQIGRASCRER